MTFERVDLGKNVTLYRGDCLEVLPMLDEVDAVVTDPPYGIGFKYSQHDDTSDGYGQWLWNIIEQAESKCPPNSPVFVWQAMLNCRHFSEWFPRDYRIFAACKGFVQYRPTAIQYSWDPVLFWGNLPGQPSVYHRDWHLQSLAPFGANRESIDHPCPRPIEQVTYIVNLATLNGQTILDPFMGSGTTGVACMQTGRNFVGIEIDPDYFDIAVKRISKALMQPPLFRLISGSSRPLTSIQIEMDLESRGDCDY